MSTLKREPAERYYVPYSYLNLPESLNVAKEKLLKTSEEILDIETKIYHANKFVSHPKFPYDSPEKIEKRAWIERAQKGKVLRINERCFLIQWIAEQGETQPTYKETFLFGRLEINPDDPKSLLRGCYEIFRELEQDCYQFEFDEREVIKAVGEHLAQN
jgi:hypothetical protein